MGVHQKNICSFCGEDAELRDSHVIPKFVFKWLKETGTGRLRNVAEINRRIEDGPKEKLLCTNCEEKFGKFESYFSRKIFRPFVSREITRFDYDVRLSQFVLSVFWRLLEVGEIIEDAKQVDKPILIKTKQRIQETLKGHITNGFHIQILAGVDLFKHEPAIRLPEGAVYYVARGIDFSVLSGRGKLYLYLKLPRFIFVLPLKGFDASEYTNAEIFESGVFDVELTRISDQAFADFIWETFSTINQLKMKMSDKQLSQSRKVGRDNWDELQTKDLGIILEYQKNKSKDW